MGFLYGIEKCEETLLRLSSPGSTLDDRLHRSWSEIDVIEPDDVNPEQYDAIEQWKSRYISRTILSVKPDGSMEQGEESEMRLLSSDLERLCTDIIAKNTGEEEDEQ